MNGYEPLHLLVRFEHDGQFKPQAAAVLARKLRELAQTYLAGIDTRYGIVVDVIEPRRPV